MKKALILLTLFPGLVFAQKWNVGGRGGFFIANLNVSGEPETKITESFGIGGAFLEYIISREVTIELNGGYKRSFGGKGEKNGTKIDSFHNIGPIFSFLVKYYFPLPPVIKKIHISVGCGPEIFSFNRWRGGDKKSGTDIYIITPIGIYYDITPKVKLDFAIIGDFSKSAFREDRSSTTINLGAVGGMKISF